MTPVSTPTPQNGPEFLHPQRELPSRPGVFVDEGLVPVLDWLNSNGAATLFSCQGSDEYPAYIVFKDLPSTATAVALLRTLAPKDKDLNSHIWGGATPVFGIRDEDGDPVYAWDSVFGIRDEDVVHVLGWNYEDTWMWDITFSGDVAGRAFASGCVRFPAHHVSRLAALLAE
jgi:hypothetical protein